MRALSDALERNLATSRRDESVKLQRAAEILAHVDKIAKSTMK